MQNLSAAVMAQRHEPVSSFDYFATPPWATRALLAHYPFNRSDTVLDPACGKGHMLRPLSEHFGTVLGSDIQDFGFGETRDFVTSSPSPDQISWIITNPPFKLAVEFILRGLEVATQGVAVFVRTSFVEGRGRYNRLFRDTPPTLRLQFVERVVLHRGDAPDPDIPIWNEQKNRYNKPTTATAYEWLVFDKSAVQRDCRCRWMGLRRAELSRPGDYLVPEPPGIGRL